MYRLCGKSNCRIWFARLTLGNQAECGHLETFGSDAKIS
jgi:hypothetical protein